MQCVSARCAVPLLLLTCAMAQDPAVVRGRVVDDAFVTARQTRLDKVLDWFVAAGALPLPAAAAQKIRITARWRATEGG